MALGAATLCLVNEHERIQRFVEAGTSFEQGFNLTGRISLDVLNGLLFFFVEFVDKLHHHKEEAVLFPYLENISQLSGGPRCTYYSELRLMREPIDQRVRSINRSLGLEETDGIPAFLIGNPINPIIEEHVLGRKLVMAMRQNVKEEAFTLFFQNFSLYRDLLFEHIQKENDCLLPMVDQYCNEEVQLNLVKEFEKINETFDFNAIARLEKIFY